VSDAEKRRARRAARSGTGKPSVCRHCGAACDVVVLAAVGTVARIWKCPMLVGTDAMDRAVALALVRSALGEGPCIVIRAADLADPR
jgi:hypothetical protein